MQLLPDEKELISTDDGMLVLTSRRVRLNQEASGETRLVSILLEEVASCSLATKSYPVLLVVAALAFVFLALNGSYGAAIGIAAILALAYWFSRRAVLVVASAGGAIEVGAAGMPRRDLVEFIDSVEAAKSARSGTIAAA